MKKTIAAILVTILASAGYVVLDRSAAEKIDVLVSQVSSQQAVIDSYGAPVNTADMQIGDTIPCYPPAGETVQAYVFDPSRTTTWSTTTTTTTTTRPPEHPTPTQPTTTGYDIPAISLTTKGYQTTEVHAQADEPTAATVTAVPDNTTNQYPTGSTTTVPAGTTAGGITSPGTTKPYTYYTTVTAQPTGTTSGATIPYGSSYLDYYYPLRANVQIQSFRCEMIKKSLTGTPVFSVTLTGKVDSKFAGREIMLRFGDDLHFLQTEYTQIANDGSFSVSYEVALASASVIPLYQVRID